MSRLVLLQLVLLVAAAGLLLGPLRKVATPERHQPQVTRVRFGAVEAPPFALRQWQGGLGGYLGQYLGMLEIQSPLRFDVRFYRSEAALRDALERGAIDVAGPIAQTSEDRRNLSLTAPIERIPMVIVATPRAGLGIVEPAHLDGLRVAVAPEEIASTYTTRRPRIRFVGFESDADVLRALHSGDVGFAIFDAPRAKHFMRERGISHLRIAGSFPLGYEPVLATRAEDNALFASLNRAMQAISEHDRTLLRDAWLTEETRPTTGSIGAALTFAGGAAVVGASLAVPFILRRLAHRKLLAKTLSDKSRSRARRSRPGAPAVSRDGWRWRWRKAGEGVDWNSPPHGQVEATGVVCAHPADVRATSFDSLQDRGARVERPPGVPSPSDSRASGVGTLRRVLPLQATFDSYRQALARGEFTLHYQPRVRLTNGEVTGYEALLRRSGPEMTQSPSAILDRAEQSAFGSQLGEWVLRAAARQSAIWRERGVTVPIAVNLSSSQLYGDQLVVLLEELVREDPVLGTHLELELAEPLFGLHVEDTTRILREVARLGLSVQVDHFGSGGAHLHRLGQMPVRALKIDRSVVSAAPGSAEAAMLVKATIALSRAMELNVIAVGVETAAQYNFLKSWGCPEAQGFLFARPSPPGEVAQTWKGRDAT